MNKSIQVFAGLISLAAVVSSLVVSAFLYTKVAPELLPWWAIAAAFQIIGSILVVLSKGSNDA